MLCKDIKKCVDGTEISSCLILKSRRAISPYAYGFMFSALLSDITGDIALVYFGGPDLDQVRAIYNSFSIGDPVFVRGTFGIYVKTGQKQIVIDTKQGEIRLAENDEIDISKFIPETNQDIDAMFTYIVGLINSIEDVHLKELLQKFVGDTEFVKNFKTLPGARLYHHSCKGGLLEHVWEMLQYCEKAIEIHPSLNKDLVISGAILHDIGKIKENEISLSIKETREGMLLGHIFFRS